MKKNWTLAFGAVGLLALGCADSSYVEPLGGAREALSTLKFTGTVTDTRGKPVAGAVVRLNGQATTTDAEGVYAVEVPVSESGYAISIKKRNFAMEAKHYLGGTPTENRHILAPSFVKQIDPLQDNRIVAESGVELFLPAKSLVDRDGATVTTPVDIGIDAYHPRNMPGDFTAVNRSGEPATLRSYGNAGFSAARAEDGASVRLADGAAATVRIPVPEVLGGPPPCIAEGTCEPKVWRFRERDGLWEEQPGVKMTFDGYTTTFVIEGTTTGTGTTVEQGTEMDTWNADIEIPQPACTVIEYNMPEECYRDVGATSETGITLTFKLRDNAMNWHTDVYPHYWNRRFDVIYAYYANEDEVISIEFPPNAPASCAANLWMSFLPSGSSQPIPNGGEITVDSGAPWGGTGVPTNPVTGAPLTFDDLAQIPPVHPCNSYVSFNTYL